MPRLRDIVFGSPDARHDDDPESIYILLDASKAFEIPLCLEGFSSDCVCLIDNAESYGLEGSAPYLARVEACDGVWNWFVDDGFGNDWGIVIRSPMGLLQLKRHLKKFVKVDIPDEGSFYFKFYRPSFFRTYLPCLQWADQQRFMKEVSCVFVEGMPESGCIEAYEIDGRGFASRRILLESE